MNIDELDEFLSEVEETIVEQSLPTIEEMKAVVRRAAEVVAREAKLYRINPTRHDNYVGRKDSGMESAQDFYTRVVYDLQLRVGADEEARKKLAFEKATAKLEETGTLEDAIEMFDAKYPGRAIERLEEFEGFARSVVDSTVPNVLAQLQPGSPIHSKVE